MNNYLTFISDCCEPCGGMWDFSISFDKLEDAINHVVDSAEDAYNVYSNVNHIYSIKDNLLYDFYDCDSITELNIVWRSKELILVSGTLKDYKMESLRRYYAND